MARKADIQADIDLDSSGFKKGIQKAKHSVKSFSRSAVGSFMRVGAAFAGIGLVKSIINLGTSAAETASKFEAVFGPAADSMNKKVQELRKTIPATTAEMQNALATFGQMAKAFGMNESEANKFSVSMATIAGDLASFHNLNSDEVFTKLSAASRKPLRTDCQKLVTSPGKIIAAMASSAVMRLPTPLTTIIGNPNPMAPLVKPAKPMIAKAMISDNAS